MHDAVALASFATTTCALLSDSTVWCWGDGFNNTLGRLRSRHHAPGPRPVHGLSGATHVSMGYHHGCAIKRDRSVWCWGGRFHRRLIGDRWSDGRKLEDPPPPQQVFRDAVALDSGYQHSCAIRRDGSVWCWGANRKGCLGSANPKSSWKPVRVQGLRQARSIATGSIHSCATTADGAVWCWGDNSRGQLGAPTPARSAAPRRVPGLPRAATVYAGHLHSCARTAGGQLWCWGQTMPPRQVGQAARKPTRVEGLKQVTHAWLGDGFTCALERGGTVRCWGQNPQGQLGRPPLPHHNRPVAARATAE